MKNHNGPPKMWLKTNIGPKEVWSSFWSGPGRALAPARPRPNFVEDANLFWNLVQLDTCPAGPEPSWRHVQNFV